ncbi:TPA: morphogenetic protein [Klebsiella pneumoniae]|nr:morphogenetic protein [Klebsiella pneumoniae]
MKERGMIFNGEMVRALLDGRKTQTRRIMAPQPADDIERCIFPNPEAIGWKSSLRHKHGSTTAHFCHYGKPGDRIWVRETFQGPLFDYDLMDSYCKDPTPFEKPEFCVYKADGVAAPEFYDANDELHCCWRPSIHMPRWASRILLEITDVRVERLQSITLGDICKEVGCGLYDFRPATYGFQVWEELWKSIYGAENWLANPWVWVIEFKRVEGGAA